MGKMLSVIPPPAQLSTLLLQNPDTRTPGEFQTLVVKLQENV